MGLQFFRLLEIASGLLERLGQRPKALFERGRSRVWGPRLWDDRYGAPAPAYPTTCGERFPREIARNGWRTLSSPEQAWVSRGPEAFLLRLIARRPRGDRTPGLEEPCGNLTVVRICTNQPRLLAAHP